MFDEAQLSEAKVAALSPSSTSRERHAQRMKYAAADAVVRVTAAPHVLLLNNDTEVERTMEEVGPNLTVDAVDFGFHV
jgi:hypothetical protein